MSGIATAIVGSAVVGAVAGAYGADKAADAQRDAANQASATQLEMFNRIQEMLSPFRDVGMQSNPLLLRMMGIGGDPQQMLESLPGYQFTRDQGLRAVQNRMGARGLGLSGAAMRGAADYATGLADQTYGAQFNRLLDMSRLGESAAANTGTFGSNAASGAAGNMISAGNAQAAGILGQANAYGNLAGSAGNLALLNQMMPGLFGSGGGGGGGGGTLIPAGGGMNYTL